MSCPAIGSASATSRASQPRNSPSSSSATTMPALPQASTGVGGSSGATSGSSSIVIAKARPARSILGGFASPSPGISMTAAPTRDSTSTKAKAQPGRPASSEARSPPSMRSAPADRDETVEDLGGEIRQRREHEGAEQREHGGDRDHLRHEDERRLVDLRDRLHERDDEADDERREQ